MPPPTHSPAPVAEAGRADGAPSKSASPAPSTEGRSALSPLRGHVLLQEWFMFVAGTGILLVILVQGRFFLIPLALAVLIFSLLSAAIDRIATLRIGPVSIPYWLANLAGIVLVAVFLLGVFNILSAQIQIIVEASPRYADRVQQMIADFSRLLGEDMTAAVLAALADIDVAAYARALAGSAGYMLATIILIALYIGFLFLERASFDDKLERLFPDAVRAGKMAHLAHSIMFSVRRYVLVKTIVSVLTGALVYAVLHALALDLAGTWAFLAILLNFIPNIGSIVATLLPTVAALVQYDSWTPVLAVLGIVGLIQFAVGNVLEPMLMGRTLNLSSFVVILSLTFWAAVWGIIGMFLAVPLTVMVMIVCSHVPALRPIAILLSADGRVPDAGPDEEPLAEEPRLRP
jgi:AI-2 transport protein TqsA